MAQGWECSSARETPRGEHRGERSRPNRRQWGRRAEGRGGHRGQSCAQLRSPCRKARSHSVNKECDRDKMIPNQGQTQLHVQFNPTWDRQDTASSKANCTVCPAHPLGTTGHSFLTSAIRDSSLGHACPCCLSG